MKNRNEEIMNYLDSFGIKHSLNGFRYLCSAIERGLESKDILYDINKLYDEIAKMYDTTSVRVQRSIRYSVKDTGYSNKEFLVRTVDKLSSV